MWKQKKRVTLGKIYEKHDILIESDDDNFSLT